MGSEFFVIFFFCFCSFSFTSNSRLLHACAHATTSSTSLSRLTSFLEFNPERLLQMQSKKKKQKQNTQEICVRNKRLNKCERHNKKIRFIYNNLLAPFSPQHLFAVYLVDMAPRACAHGYLRSSSSLIKINCRLFLYRYRLLVLLLQKRKKNGRMKTKFILFFYCMHQTMCSEHVRCIKYRTCNIDALEPDVFEFI